MFKGDINLMGFYIINNLEIKFIPYSLLAIDLNLLLHKLFKTKQKSIFKNFGNWSGIQ
jgi:hypothetical protein